MRWDGPWRDDTWAQLDRRWDVVVIGGGITGAGVLRAAASRGLRALLLEQKDFAWGTSSRSTQLIHGGLRYLAHGDLRLTRELVRERERLLREAPGLVEPMTFVVPLQAHTLQRRLQLRGALDLYDALAGRMRRHGVGAEELTGLLPLLEHDAYGGLRYLDGQTDDARLVMRVLREAVRAGAVALNAAEVTTLLRSHGRVCGVTVVDRSSGRTAEVRAPVVVNATGAWADRLRREVGGAARMRPVRGSHLLFAASRFPLPCGVNVLSPRDRRPVTVMPWEGATLVGSTDLDHLEGLDEEVAITRDEVAYLLECLDHPFRTLQLTESDIVSSWSGVRPIVTSGAAASCDEPRRHVVWDEQGLLTVTGGKLTTFRLLARDVLDLATRYLSSVGTRPATPPVPVPTGRHAPRLVGRHLGETDDLVASSRPGEWEQVAGTPTTWAEVRWSARCEGITSLDDLMLRRTRLGLLLPRGGQQVLDGVRSICAEELGWTPERWRSEVSAYTGLIRSCHGVPG